MAQITLLKSIISQRTHQNRGDKMDRYIFENKTAIITGGNAGIGKAVAYSLAEKGSNLAIIGRNKATIDEVCADLSVKYPTQKITGYQLDISNFSEIPNTINQIANDHENIGLLVNNAGIAMGGKFEELSISDIETVFNINFKSQIVMIKETLPHLKKVEGSHIANVSSVFGIITPSGQSAYSASKFAVKGFSEVLRQELKPLKIGVSTIFPGGVKTNIAANTKIGENADKEAIKKEAKSFESNFTMTPEYAAEIIIKGIEKRKVRILIGSTTKFLDFMTRLLPVKYEFLLKMVK